MSSRLDVWLVEKGFAPSRQKAQALIASGRVVAAGPEAAGGTVATPRAAATAPPTALTKPSLLVDEKLADRIRILNHDGPEFVSRGGLKLHGAIQKTGVSFSGCTVLDIGISTGGFADCALQNGAARVVGVDVGHGQLAKSLRNDRRVTLLEGINARDLAAEPQVLSANGGRRFGIVVVDVSFISLRLILPSAAVLLAEGGHLIALVKPQFEVGRDGIGRGGLVKDPSLYGGVESAIRDVCASVGLKVESYFDSPILGSDGNREFFIHATVPQLGLF